MVDLDLYVHWMQSTTTTIFRSFVARRLLCSSLLLWHRRWVLTSRQGAGGQQWELGTDGEGTADSKLNAIDTYFIP